MTLRKIRRALPQAENVSDENSEHKEIAQGLHAFPNDCASPEWVYEPS